MPNFPTATLPSSTSSKKHLSYNQLRALWIQAGGAPSLASQMAAVALAETSGNPADPWKVSYYNAQRGGKAATFKTSLAASQAAVAAASGVNGLGYWPTYQTGASQSFYRAVTPSEKAQAATAANQAKAASGAYVQSAAQLSAAKSEAVAAAKATAHISDPWVTVVHDGRGDISGFGEATGASPPADVLTIGGIPATRSEYQYAWSNTYASDYEAFSGKPATPAVQAQILESGISTYQLKQQLADAPGFTSSPVYKANAAGIADQAKQALGTAAPASFVKDAIAESWDAATLSANLKKLPGYATGPVVQQALDQAKDQYALIYGTPPDPLHEDWLKSAAVNGWSSDEIAQRLRSDPAYVNSPEFSAKASNFLQSLGLPFEPRTPMPNLPTKTQIPAAIGEPPPVEGALHGGHGQSPQPSGLAT